MTVHRYALETRDPGGDWIPVLIGLANDPASDEPWTAAELPAAERMARDLRDAGWEARIIDQDDRP